MKKKAAVIGGFGQLGTDLCEQLSTDYDVIPLAHADIEITDIDNAKKKLSDIKPDVVLNTAAAHVVPKCETTPAEAFLVNGIGALNLARLSEDLKYTFVHYSTDYVFDGAKEKPYVETDRPNPLNVYANTKLAGEYFALNYSDKSYVIRVSGIYGKVPSRAKGGNFITTILRVAKEKPEVRVVNDEILTPTPTFWIAKNTLELLTKEKYGLYHMACQGPVSWYDFTKVIFETLNIKTPLYPQSVKGMIVNVKRPMYSALENKNLTDLGINNMPPWKNALVSFLKEHHAK